MKLKKYLSLFLLMFSFLFIIEVNAAETGDLGDYHYSESNSSSDYLKLELSDGKIVLIQFDSSKSAGIVNRMKEQLLSFSFDGAVINRETRYLSVQGRSDRVYNVSSNYFSKPTRGDIAAVIQEDDAGVITLSHFQIYFVEVVDARVPVFAHVIYGMDQLNNLNNGITIRSARFVNVENKNDESDKNSNSSNTNTVQNQSNEADKKAPINTSVESAGTSYCSDPNFIKPFRFIGRLFAIIKIIIPIIIIVFGVIDLFKAVVGSKDDEIKKSLRSLVFRALAGVIIFFIPTFINLIFTLVDDWNKYSTDYSKCSKCISDPRKC